MPQSGGKGRSRHQYEGAAKNAEVSDGQGETIRGAVG